MRIYTATYSTRKITTSTNITLLRSDKKLAEIVIRKVGFNSAKITLTMDVS